MQQANRKKARRTDRPTLPELDETKRSVLNSLASLQSRRSYQQAIDEFIAWYCSEPRLALNRGVVLQYRMQLESQQLAPATVNVRLAAVRRLAYEAAEHITEVRLFPISMVDSDRYRKIVHEYVYPPLDIFVRVFEGADGKGVAAILVDGAASKPYIVSKMIERRRAECRSALRVLRAQTGRYPAHERTEDSAAARRRPAVDIH